MSELAIALWIIGAVVASITAALGLVWREVLDVRRRVDDHGERLAANEARVEEGRRMK